jgi:sarcosine oxidase
MRTGDRTADVDVAVIGLGVLGAAALRESARDGGRVLGIEQDEPGHRRGSSHGRSRALRFLYHAPDYVALLPAAVEGWRALEAESGRRLYWNCGTLFFARRGNDTFDRNVAIMAAAGVPHVLLDEAAARTRFPALAMTPGSVGVFNEDGGMVDADAAVGAFVSGAALAGAQIRTGTRVLGLDLDGDRPRIATDRGMIAARHVVIAAGAWTPRLLADLRLPIRVTRQHWFTMRPATTGAHGPDRLPVWADYDTMFYGFPDHGPGLKVAHDAPGPDVDPEIAVRPTASGEEERRMTAYLRERFPGTALTLDDVGTCLYTLTPDEDFLLGIVPGSGGTASVVVGLSHAFKFAPVLGRILADLASTGTTSHRIDRFRIDRFAPAPAG